MKTTPCEDAIRMLEAHLDASATWSIGTNTGLVQLEYVGPHGEHVARGENLPEACVAMVRLLKVS